MAGTFSLLQRRLRSEKASKDLVTPICFSFDAQNRLQSCKNPVLIIIEGKTGAGKSTRLNQLIHAKMRVEGPFRSSGGGKGVTSDFQAVGPITLEDFCNKWRIPKTAGDTFNLFFVDSEGTGNANGVDENLGKALAAVSAITTVRIAMSQNRLCDDIMDGVASTLKLQCLKTNRTSQAEMSSAVVFMYRDVGFEGEPARSLDEMERRRRAQDQAGFATICEKFPQLGFKSDNLLVLLQPQLTDMGMPIDFAVESYLESLRDLARFIDSVCRTKRSPGFAWVNSILTNIAAIIHRLPAGSTVNISDTVRLIYIFQAKAVAKSIIASHSQRAKMEVEKIPLRNFPFDCRIDPKYIDEALSRFEEQCNAFYHGLLSEILDKASLLRQDICERVRAEWGKQMAASRAVFLEQMNRQVTDNCERVAQEE
jgi:hypothetical protein